jgi:hypothetical protein
MVPPSRKSNDYCLQQRTRDFAKASRERYRAINVDAFKRHKNIEVRLHSGTIDAKKIGNFIDLLLLFANAPKITQFPRLLKKVTERFGIGNELEAYVEQRIRKFAKERGEIEGQVKFLDKKVEADVAIDF